MTKRKCKGSCGPIRTAIITTERVARIERRVRKANPWITWGLRRLIRDLLTDGPAPDAQIVREVAWFSKVDPRVA